MISSIQLIPTSRGVIRKSQRTISITFSRSFASTANTNPPSTSSSTPSSPSPPQIYDERTLLSQLSPLKRIICLCPVPLGRGRVSWSGGDSFYPDDETINLDFQSQPQYATRNMTQMQPLKVAKYRYGERFAIGVAVSDPYLTHAQPVSLGDGDDEEDALKRRFVAEIVPTFRCDAHNLGSSPIFHTNLPYFRNDFLQHIGHFDIGAIVLALPMKQSLNPLCPTPTKVQLEQERRLDQVREYLLGVLQNYVSVIDDEEEEEEDFTSNRTEGNSTPKRQPRHLGPLNIQGRIDHRLSIADVLAKPNNNDCQSGNWDHIYNSLRQIQNQHTMARGTGGVNKYLQAKRENGTQNVFSSVPPEIHAAVALNTMMEKYTSGFHNGFF
mmetsp:Transcript_38619/g.83220  ORF Transcript_38619/g.83220 Transcript_38619/m.83220 type:complete len:382 (+) Transcript_38619:146-1291(+)